MPRHRSPAKNLQPTLQYGLYAPFLSARDRRQVSRMPDLEMLPEIRLLRIQLGRILALLEQCEDPDHLIKLYNTFFTCIQRLLTAIHTQRMLLGSNRDSLDELWEALADYQVEIQP